MLTVLTLAAPPSTLAQSAGDRQYADPLVTDGGGQSGQQSPSSPGGDDRGAVEQPAPAPVAAPAEATLPRTGAEPLDLALAGLALAACGALGLALPRRTRHARR